VSFKFAKLNGERASLVAGQPGGQTARDEGHSLRDSGLQGNSKDIDLFDHQANQQTKVAASGCTVVCARKA
jgi:hypothetical protein